MVARGKPEDRQIKAGDCFRRLPGEARRLGLRHEIDHEIDHEGGQVGQVPWPETIGLGHAGDRSGRFENKSPGGRPEPELVVGDQERADALGMGMSDQRKRQCRLARPGRTADQDAVPVQDKADAVKVMPVR